MLIPIVLAMALAANSPVQAGQYNPTAILVDKKMNQLHVTENVDGKLRTIKTYHVTLGRVKGDKEEEGDLKTPEGIYTFKTRVTAPTLKPKFGAMAFYLNYPNAYDELAGHTGSHIMLHATNEPERLKQNYDSEGCVVVKNEELKEIQSYVRIGLTPILIFPELTEDFLNPGMDAHLKDFFENWVKAWESKDLDKYIASYHTDFSANGMNKAKWKAYKGQLNSQYKTIHIGPEDVLYYKHPKYSMITFTQNYYSTTRGGGTGHKSRGTKILFVAEEAGQPKIIGETYSTLMWR